MFSDSSSMGPERRIGFGDKIRDPAGQVYNVMQIISNGDKVKARCGKGEIMIVGVDSMEYDAGGGFYRMKK